MKTKLLSIFLICSSLTGWAQEIKMTPELRDAFAKTTELRIAEADSLIRFAEKENSKNPAVPYMKGAILVLKLFINEDEEVFNSEKENIEDYISLIEKASDSDPQKRFMISQLRLGLAVLHARSGNNISAGWQFLKAYNLLKDNHEEFPKFYPNYVPLGVLYTAIGSLPDGYQSIASLIGIDGSIEEGMKLIKDGYWNTISEPSYKYFRDYYGFIYSYISLNLIGNTNISPETLSLNYTKSSYLIYMQALIEIDKGNARRGLTLLKNRPIGEGYYDFDYLDYYTGRMALAFSPDTAFLYLNKYLKNNTSANYEKSTYRYLSWYAMLKGDEDLLKEYRKKVLEEGKLETGADKQAYREAQKPFNEVLIKGRIYFDGGRYEKAINYLLSQKTRLKDFTEPDKVEFNYRLGRIYQEKDEFDKAIQEFKKALEYQPEEATFALGNSALQLAIILEKKGDKENAKKYYQKTLTYKGFPFYEGLHQKAKSGLDRLK